jgi:hypothetical protein
MIELLPPEQQKAAHDLMMSNTMSLLLGLAQGESPLDWTRTEDLKSGFCTASLEVIRALDAGRIHFDRSEDAAMFHGLLMVAMQYVFDGTFGQGAELVKAN